MEFSNTDKNINKTENTKSISLLNDHENIGVLLTESAFKSEHQSNICMVLQEKRTKEKHLQS